MIKVTACSVCSATFSYEKPDGQGGRLRRYCSSDCRKAMDAQRERMARGHLRDCCVCGKSFYTYSTSENPCCSKSCIANFGWSAKPVRTQTERPLLENKCVICSAPLRYAVWGGRPVETCPSKSCKRARDNQRTQENYVPAEPVSRECAECGQLFTVRGYRLYCTQECSWKRHHRVRRARRKGLPREQYGLVDITRRDGFDCAICAVPVDMSLTYPHRLSPSVDHIVPVALGGGDVLSNVQLAHLECNWAKGARVA